MAKAPDFLGGPTILKASSLKALWPTDLILILRKDLLNIGFALSKSSYLQRAYSVTVRKRMSIAVC